MILKKLTKEGLLTPPKWLHNNLVYVANVGSHAYGTNNDDSDYDYYGVCIPPKDYIYPHLSGRILGFGTPPPKFDVYQQITQYEGKEYDFNIFGIVKFFQLCYENNPNMLDVLYAPIDCIIHTTQMGIKIRENRHLFLSKRCWPRFKGYAFSQIKKIQNPKSESNRAASIEEHGYDIKAASHAIRLLLQVRQLLSEGEMDLRKYSGYVGDIKRGLWPLQSVIQYYDIVERELELLYQNTTLPENPDEEKLRQLLQECLDFHYQTNNIVDNSQKIINEIINTLQKYEVI